MENLVGQYFRRNKYGLSLWINRIDEVSIRLRKIHLRDDAYEPVLMVRKHGGEWYDADEIIVFLKDGNKQGS